MKRHRTLVPARNLRETPRQSAGGRTREALIRRAQESIQTGSKSFSAASMLFDRDTRDRAHLLYAWCRRCDDIADGQDHGSRDDALPINLSEAKARDRVEAIRVLSHRALDQKPTADIAFDALGLVAAECRLTKEMTDDVIDGFALDAAGWRPRSEGDLMRYCYHVAGAVGIMMARIMGVDKDDHETLDRACDLGLAFQLNNIARDIWEDNAAGRCYLPLEWLAEADIPPGQHMRPQYREQLVALTNRLVDLSQEHEAAARLGAKRLRFRHRWAILSSARIYGEIGRQVRERGAGAWAWDSRVYTSASDKAKFLVQGFFEAMRAPPPVETMPQWTRSDLVAIARMNAPPAPIPKTPLLDETVRPAMPPPLPI